ncbi:ankyrin repeat domain-containing protein [Flocculibacter collagenilyticus]|uniref:ankyrin repeat domain-containing protein n=1 Tax=Flocculibacter collagenilyticus TaxID=2744479 RepID=UPI0018F67272|nr:ankyrin repeat domain-containing protein [Flocculibacter collagenilyticus]
MSVDQEFYTAIVNNDLKTAKLLIKENSVNINHTEPNFNKTALSSSAYLGLTKCVDYLLSIGVDIDKTDGLDMTPLMTACSSGKVKGSRVALKLIEHGANVNYVREDDEMTALKFAVGDCKPEVIEALIQAGADIDGPQNSEQTALMLAARNNHISALKILVEAGADIKAKCKLPWAKGLTALDLAKLQNHKKASQYLSSIDGT